MIKTLLTLAVAGLVLIGCKNEDGSKTVTYMTVDMTCNIDGERKTFNFADNELVYHNVYINDYRINVEKRSRNRRDIIEDHYWTNNPTCSISKKYREVLIMPKKSDI